MQKVRFGLFMSDRMGILIVNYVIRILIEISVSLLHKEEHLPKR